MRLGIALVVGSLLAVVVADAMVAQGQVRMTAMQSNINDQLAIQRTARSEVAQLAAPDRVVAQGINHGLIAPAQVVNLPQVPLNLPLPAPDTSPLPVALAQPVAAAKPVANPTVAAANPKTPSGPATTAVGPVAGGTVAKTPASSSAPANR